MPKPVEGTRGKWAKLISPSCFPWSRPDGGSGRQRARMFEWGHSQQIICFRSPGNSRVTRIRFNHQGNKVTSRSVAESVTGTHVRLFLASQTASWCAPVGLKNIFTSRLTAPPTRREPQRGVRLQLTLFFIQWLIALTSGSRLRLIIFSDGAAPVPAPPSLPALTRS